ncbi:MAG: hypothetical protein OEU26_25920 [Candidatus Tectomicrobia bacterium]|nr:hypothetical protein [Candidatus Tectomicrobia bacterium]
MVLLYATLDALAKLFSHAGLWLVIWVAVLVGFSIFILRINRVGKQSRPWVVRKGACPFCNNELFGTTREYQRLNLLETLAPESKYLCTRCDQEKVSGLLSKLS